MKTRTSLSREMTINTGNFSNIKPSVSISLVHDLDDTGIVYKEMASILDSLIALEALALAEEMEVVSQSGWAFYKESLQRSINDVLSGLDEHVKVLSGILEDD